MAVCGPLHDLPGEILEQILRCRELSCRDLGRVSQVCSALRRASNGNALWKAKLEQRWPGLVERCVRGGCLAGDPSAWKALFRRRVECATLFRKQMAKMSSEFFEEEEVSHRAFAGITEFSERSLWGYFFVTDELSRTLHDGDEYANLTVKFYAEKVLRHVRQNFLRSEWRRFLELPEERRSLEKGAVLLAHWCQPTEDVSESGVASRLDDVARRVGVEAANRMNDVRILATDVRPETALPESMWTPHQCSVILQCLNEVFARMGFHGNLQSYYMAQNSYIDKVLVTKTGIPITLCLVYASVARRLGVVCEPVGFPSHFLLRWEEHPELDGDLRYTYIDVFGGCRFLNRWQCSSVAPLPMAVDSSAYEAVTPVEVFERMAQNLVEVGRRLGTVGDGLVCLRNALELKVLLSPDDVDSRLLLARVCLHLNINLDEVMSGLQEIQARDPSQTRVVAHMYHACLIQLEAQRKRKKDSDLQLPTEVHIRDDGVNFAVGMIMKHKRYHYTCVVSGWDLQCAASQEWMTQMGVHNLSHRERQPFYSVLVDDGSKRYAAQENLEVSSEPKLIRHPDVGRYFKAFTGTHFLPNEEVDKEYPEDSQVRERLVELHYSR